MGTRAQTARVREASRVDFELASVSKDEKTHQVGGRRRRNNYEEPGAYGLLCQLLINCP